MQPKRRSAFSRFLVLFDTTLRHLFRVIDGRQSKRGLLLVSSGGIGDTILFSVLAPFFGQLVADDEPRTIVTQFASTAVGFLLPPNSTQIAINHRKFRRNLLYRAIVGWRLFRLHVRIAIATDHLRHPLTDDAFIFYTDAAQKIGFTPRPWAKHDAALQANLQFYDQTVPITHAPMHRYVRWLHLLAHLTHKPLSFIPIRRATQALQPTIKDRRVVIHPFASTRTRQPSVAWFQDLIAALPPDYSVVLSCGPGDLERNPDFAALADTPRVTLDLSSLSDKAAWIGGVPLVISVDTSVMHLAAICGAPTVCIASAAHIIDSVPYDPRINAGNVQFIVLDVDCAGCLGQCRHPLVEGRYPCLQNIDVKSVIPQALKMLSP